MDNKDENKPISFEERKQKKIEKKMEESCESCDGDDVIKVCPECAAKEKAQRMNIFYSVYNYCYEMLDKFSHIDITDVISVIEDVKMELYRDDIMSMVEMNFDVKRREDDEEKE